MVRNLPGPPKLFGVFNLPRHQEVRCWLLSLEPSAPASSCRSWSDRACLKHLHPHCVACCGNHCAHESAYPSSDHPLAYTRAQDTQPMHLARRAATVRSSLLPHRAWTLSYCMQPGNLPCTRSSCQCLVADVLCVLISFAGLVQRQLPAGATTAKRRRSDFALYMPRMGQQRVLATALSGGGVGET